MLSVIIPAHNEEAAIARCLRALTDGARQGELDVIVVCNGCRDATAQVAGGFGAAVRVIETQVASKANALNLGDEAAKGFPRLYVDADVILPLQAVREMADVLSRADGVLAAAPAVNTVFPPGSSWAVRAYYAFWMALPYVQEGMTAAGVYALNQRGRQRFERFPEVIADDGFVRLQLAPRERVEVGTARCTVSAPGKLWDLILIKTRSRLGFYQLRARFPELLPPVERARQYGPALAAVLRRPRLWPCAVPYLWVNLIARYRALRQRHRLSEYVWERDNSSRQPAEAVLGGPSMALEASRHP